MILYILAWVGCYSNAINFYYALCHIVSKLFMQMYFPEMALFSFDKVDLLRADQKFDFCHIGWPSLLLKFCVTCRLQSV